VIPHSKAYTALRDKSQSFLDFVVLSCTATPTLVQHIKTLGTAGLLQDHFKGAPNGIQLTAYAATYQDALARMIVITLFSQFEAYVTGLLSEIVDFHGGAAKFQATADRRAKGFLVSISTEVTEAKRKLQEPAKAKNAQSYKKHSATLVKNGFRFPSELLAPYGVKNLIQKSKPKGSKAYEIQELLRDGICYPLSTKDDVRINAIRDVRNKIAHGNPGPLSLKDALACGKDLRDIAVKVDKHATEHFFVLETYA
jgi:hypothetical protein